MEEQNDVEEDKQKQQGLKKDKQTSKNNKE